MNDRKRVRRHYVVNKSFQYRFIVKAMLITTLSFVIAFAAIILYFYLEYGFSDEEGNKILVQVSNGVRVDNLVSPVQLIFPPLILGAAVVYLGVFVFSLIYSNRLAGPIYRFRMILEMYKRGDYDVDIVLRKKDEFKELAEDFNEYAKLMRE